MKIEYTEDIGDAEYHDDTEYRYTHKDLYKDGVWEIMSWRDGDPDKTKNWRTRIITKNGAYVWIQWNITTKTIAIAGGNDVVYLGNGYKFRLIHTNVE